MSPAPASSPSPATRTRPSRRAGQAGIPTTGRRIRQTTGQVEPCRGTEPQGHILSEWMAKPGPNQCCPVSLLPLTDITNSTGKTTLTNKINSMWTRDAGGTQVHVGMAWGWRTLSPTGPFTAVNGHPLSYTDANTTGWKKVVV